jgi:glutathione peroxidase
MTRLDYRTEVTSIEGTKGDLMQYQGKVLLVVNTASRCGFTPQYEDLERLWKQYRDRGLVVLGFPCNQFGRQEPGGEQEIQTFCQRNYGVTFPMQQKIAVNGRATHPLYRQLKAAAPGLLGTEAIKWNFTKFLVGRDGTILKRYAPNDKPMEIAAEIEAALK